MNMSQKISFNFDNAKFMASDAEIQAIKPRIEAAKKTLVEKDLVEKSRDTLSFVDPLFELWLKREYGI